MVAAGKREAVLRLRFSERFREVDVKIQGAARWRKPGEDADLITPERGVCLSFGPEAPAPRSEEDSTRIAEALLAYIAAAIKGREAAKFAFTRSLSDILVILGNWGGGDARPAAGG